MMDPEKILEEQKGVLHEEKVLHEEQEHLQEAAQELLVEQKVLANRMISHLQEFEHERELVDEELLGLAQWKEQEEGRLRKVIIGLMVFVGLWALGGVISGWYIWDSVQTNQKNLKRINVLGDQNATLIKQVDTLNRTQANQVYKDCVSRNSRAKVSIKEFGRLERIALRDDNPGEARFWREYRVKISKQKLPPCEKPKDAATGDGDPTEKPSAPTTTVPRS